MVGSDTSESSEELTIDEEMAPNSKELDFNLYMMWGDEEETMFYVSMWGRGERVLYRFQLNKSKPPTSLANRVVSCSHGLKVQGPSATFSSRSLMRKEIYSRLITFWIECCDAMSGFASEAGLVVEVDTDSSGHVSWKINRHSLFETYVRRLRHFQDSMPLACTDHVDFAVLIPQGNLGGRGSTIKVLLAPNDSFLHVFKGIDFETFLVFYEVEDDISTSEIMRMWYHATIEDPATKTEAVCGCLYPYYRAGDLGTLVHNKTSERISVQRKAKWCHQIAESVRHTHLVAHTYHMDIKPGNFLVDNNDDLILIDWEQQDGPATTLAPEVDGMWDIEEIPSQGPRTLSTFSYTKYEGPERRNTVGAGFGSNSWSVWNVFPLWSKLFPRALAAAEVFAAGRTMWIVLRQPNTDNFEEVNHPCDLVIDWDETDDVPRHWKDMVHRCMSKDPNTRPDLDELTAFWEREQ